MSSEVPKEHRWWNSLRARLIVMISLALLPVGLMATLQTRNVTEKARRNAELALLAVVEQAALRERLVIQRAYGVADGIAGIAGDLETDSARCKEHLAEIVERTQRFSFIAIVEPDGQIACSSSGTQMNVKEFENYYGFLQSRTPTVNVISRPVISGTPIISVAVPILDGEQISGHVLISIPHHTLAPPDQENEEATRALKDIVTFNNEGEVLSFRGGEEFNANRLPAGLNLAALATEKSNAFSSLSRVGKDRIYSVVPIQDRQLFVLGIWDAQSGLAEQIVGRYPQLIFPILMWLVSLAVVIGAIHHLVLRHVRSLRRQMVRFARDRALQEPKTVNEMPTELREIQTSFSTMAYSIMQDEANLEDAVREKNVLIREIHHRVKNNLQLISSIVNMQIRNVDSPEAKEILRRVQDRVLSLATIHRDLYQSNSAGLVNVGNLINEVIEKSVHIGSDQSKPVKIESDIEDIMLYPDQAVPMSLLAAEAATNAMKYVGAANGGDRWIKVSFVAGEGKTRVFHLSNCVGDEPVMQGTGMGTKLIKAFAIQLDAKLDVEDQPDEYALTVTFDAADFIAQAESY
ncbi:hypothetical protein GI582_02175 [Sulfitobacter sp. BDSS02]|nr:hypothetical protein [Sulfitobacter sp. BDSS02]MBR9847850.1 hypothetical protein [Paracoccaceae bacterium]